MTLRRGVYAIINLRTNVRYIGSAKNIYSRWREHKKFLRKGTHKNHYLQNSWNKHGESCFSFFVIEECNFEYLIETEQKYIDFYEKNGGIYNLNKNASGFHGRKHSDKTKQKISETKKAQNLSIKHTDESKTKISQALKGKKRQPLTAEHKIKISFSSDRHPMSEENKKKILEVNAKQFSLISPSGEVFDGKNISLFSREHGLSRQGLCHVLSGERVHHKGWKKNE